MSEQPIYPDISQEHAFRVRTLAKPGADIIAGLTPEKAHLWHMASALMGEAGELFDAIKKHVIYGKKLDHINVIEELGDIEFYFEGIRDQLGITRNEVLYANLAKLADRYPGYNYTDEAATKRADKTYSEGTDVE